jgi:hypothetical protein
MASTITPIAASPTSHPTMKSGPFTLARRLTSIRITAMIGMGLSATPTARGRMSPMASCTDGSFLSQPGHD